GIEVLLLADRVDEWMLSFLHEFEGKALASVAKGGLDLGAVADEKEKAEQQQLAEENRDLVAAVKAALGERVKDVRVTFRLTESAACLVSEEAEMSGHLQRLLKAAGQKAPAAQPILELNPVHPLVAQLRTMQLEQPAAFVARVNRLLLDARAA
ncbi:MAG: molecular chaperone HtpG, partial [Burkholderiaceae bacterium]|nr:molecular chaperone HtpG [Burkholderiaceae bacterium]